MSYNQHTFLIQETNFFRRAISRNTSIYSFLNFSKNYPYLSAEYIHFLAEMLLDIENKKQIPRNSQ